MTRGAKCAGLSASVVVVVALVAGCTGSDPDPEPTPTAAVESPSPSASPSPEVTADALTPPVRPPEMDQDDEAGAAAAARYFLELHMYVMATGDLSEWDMVTWDQCESCAAIRSEVNRVYSAGGHFAPSEIEFARVESGPQHEALGGFPVEVDYVLSAGAEYDAAGVEVATGVEESGTLAVDVLRQPGGWTLMGLNSGAGA